MEAPLNKHLPALPVADTVSLEDEEGYTVPVEELLRMRTKLSTAPGPAKRVPGPSRLGGLSRQEGVVKRRPVGAPPAFKSLVTGRVFTPSPSDVRKPGARMDKLLDRLRDEMSTLRDHGTQMSRRVSQLYAKCEDTIKVVSPVNTKSAVPAPLPVHTETDLDTSLNSTLVDEFEKAKLNSSRFEEESVLEALPADFSVLSSAQDVTIDNISVLELPASLNKSVDSEGRPKNKPVTFSKIKKIDKCSSSKWERRLSSMHSPRARRTSPFVRAHKAKRRLSEEFDMQARQNYSPVKIERVKEDEVAPVVASDAGNGWYVTLDDPHIYENLQYDCELNVDSASIASCSPGKDSTTPTITTPSPSAKHSKKKLTAVKRSMEKIIKDLKSEHKSIGLVRTDSRCSSLKLVRCHSAHNLLKAGAMNGSITRQEPVYETVHLPAPLWGQVSPPRCPNASSPETIRRCLFTMPKYSTPHADVSSGTIAWEASFDNSASQMLSESTFDISNLSTSSIDITIPSLSKSQFELSIPGLSTSRSTNRTAACNKSSAFRSYSKNTDQKTTEQKPCGEELKAVQSEAGKGKFFDSIIVPNNCQYICMDKSARVEVLKSVSKRLFETPSLDDMRPVSIPDLKAPKLTTTKWFATPKLDESDAKTPTNKLFPTPKLDDMERVSIPEFSPSVDRSYDGDETLVAMSPSPRSHTSSDSGRGSCSSIGHLELRISRSGEESLESIDEPIYETIAETDTYAGLGEVTFDLGRSDMSIVPPAEHTYARIDETLSPEPPALPERPVEYNLFERIEQDKKKQAEAKVTKVHQEPGYAKVNKCTHCASCKNCTQKPGGKRELRPDEMVKKTDIVDMNAFHMYTVADVLESMERLAGHIPDNPQPKARSNLYGLISDAKTRRDISQALELETKIRTHLPTGVDKYKPHRSSQPAVKQPLRPIENIYNQTRRAPQTAEMDQKYKTLPISQVSRLSYPHSNSIKEEPCHPAQQSFSRHTLTRQPLQQPNKTSHTFQKAGTFRRSMGSIPSKSFVQCVPNDRKNKNVAKQPRPMSANIENIKTSSQENRDEPLYCNIEEMKQQGHRGKDQSHKVHRQRLTQLPAVKGKQKDNQASAKVTVKENAKVAQVETSLSHSTDNLLREKSKQSTRPLSMNVTTLARPSSTLDMSVVSGHERLSASMVDPGPFRRTRSAMQLHWKGMNVGREIFC